MDFVVVLACSVMAMMMAVTVTVLDRPIFGGALCGGMITRGVNGNLLEPNRPADMKGKLCNPTRELRYSLTARAEKLTSSFNGARDPEYS